MATRCTGNAASSLESFWSKLFPNSTMKLDPLERKKAHRGVPGKTLPNGMGLNSHNEAMKINELRASRGFVRQGRRPWSLDCS